MKRIKAAKSQSIQKKQFASSKLFALGIVIIVLLLLVVLSFFIALPQGLNIFVPAVSLFIFLAVARSKIWRNTSASARKKVIVYSLLVVFGIVLFLFPKESDFISQQKGKSKKCECIGFKSWENFRSMGIAMSYCNGILYSCINK